MTMDGILQPAPIYETPAAPSATALSIAELRVGLRAQAETAALCSQLGFAEAITVQAVRAYWSRIAAGVLPLFQPPCDARFLPEPLAAAAVRIGEAVTALPDRRIRAPISERSGSSLGQRKRGQGRRTR